MTGQRFVYMDHAATTQPHPDVIAAMLPYLRDHYGNPSSIYGIARDAREAVEVARQKTAATLGAGPEEIYFTAGGTESDNWAIKGTAFAQRKKGNHIITSAIEHHAVLHTCGWLEKQGFTVTYLPVDGTGLVNPSDVERAITEKTILITIMHANNEIGTIEPIAEIGKIAQEHSVTFHTDAVQVVGAIPVNVKELGVDLLSLSAHKFYGPKGAGALYIRGGRRPDSLLHGGGQERKKRAGTENVAGIVGLGKAIELAGTDIPGRTAVIRAYRDQLTAWILAEIPHTRLNGHAVQRLPGNINISFAFIEGESMLLLLDSFGIAASTGSACTSGSLEPSHVLMAIGLPHEIAHGSLRLTLGEENTPEDIAHVQSVLPGVVSRLREMSPLYQKMKEQRVS
ncbi:MAG: cysteine desulfurase NifS [Methanomicrobiales archaeon]|nr:cysteine desulfurase NifS [Methanomicrobiales archaeon]